VFRFLKNGGGHLIAAHFGNFPEFWEKEQEKRIRTACFPFVVCQKRSCYKEIENAIKDCVIKSKMYFFSIHLSFHKLKKKE
jgi:hypothetical protein